MTEEEADINFVQHDILWEVSYIGKGDGGQETEDNDIKNVHNGLHHEVYYRGRGAVGPEPCTS